MQAQLRRALGPNERAWLQLELARARRYVRGWDISMRIVWVMAALGTVPFYFLAYDRSRPFLARVLLYVLLFLPAASVPPAFAEMIVGRGGKARFLFVVPLLLALVGFGASALGGDWRGGIAFVLFILGITTLPLVVMLWWRYLKQRELLPAVERDFESGDVLVFQGTPDGRPEQLVKAGLSKVRTDECWFAVLPDSGVVLPSPALRVPAWVTLEVVHTAPIVGSTVIAPVPGLPIDPEIEVLQRHMSAAEADEIARHRKHLARRAFLVFLGMGYFAARIAQVGEIAMRKSHHGQVSIGGWVIALLVAAYFGASPLRLRALLGRTLAERKVFIIRKRDAPSDAPALGELLAGTRIEWTIQGMPAGWRRKKL
jgi:hypothetical protein